MEKEAGLKRLHASNTEKINNAVVPKWLIVMLKTRFFNTCMAHHGFKKNEMDRFCIDCHSAFCQNCLPSHTPHKHVKIRRYIYSDVIKRQDLCKLFNCSGIQTYLTNKAKVLFLKQRNQHRQRDQQRHVFKGYRCAVCERRLQDNNSLYCSIACKVSAIDEGCSKRHKLKQSRKGIPLRAPMV
ncbi:hypothetical protein MANES_17G083200v8 [Manihot esculenta]|uniref:B box-type domain-containing protein n=2 Tax=Manihot esculenta TaxID=3983 RepID=A0A2C9U756_MANES|nr:hypothetical protein MANES_17G083200v8 [Manihot esculenta]